MAVKPCWLCGRNRLIRRPPGPATAKPRRRAAAEATLRRRTPNPPRRPNATMSVFDTSKIRRHNTQLAVAEATKAAEDDAVDLGVPRCCGAFTPSTRVVSRNDGSGWFLFRF